MSKKPKCHHIHGADETMTDILSVNQVAVKKEKKSQKGKGIAHNYNKTSNWKREIRTLMKDFGLEIFASEVINSTLEKANENDSDLTLYNKAWNTFRSRLDEMYDRIDENEKKLKGKTA